MNNRIYAQMLMIALIPNFNGMKAKDDVAQVINLGSESIPLLDDRLSGDETAVFEDEPGLALPSSNKEIYNAHNVLPYNSSSSMLGGDTASRPSVDLITNVMQPNSDSNMLGRDTASRSPLTLGQNNLENIQQLFEERSSMDDIKKSESSEFTDENILEGLADIFKEEPQILNEPAVDTNVADYLEQLSQQIKTLNDELEKMLSHARLNELAEQCPLLINRYVDESSVKYPDLMHSGGYVNAPNTGEITPIKDISL